MTLQWLWSRSPSKLHATMGERMKNPMRRTQSRKFNIFATTLVLLAGGCKDSTPDVQAAEDAVPVSQTLPAECRIFDTTLYRNKPAANGLSREMVMIYPNFMAY